MLARTRLLVKATPPVFATEPLTITVKCCYEGLDKRADDDPLPIIPLEEEALASWIMGVRGNGPGRLKLGISRRSQADKLRRRNETAGFHFARSGGCKCWHATSILFCGERLQLLCPNNLKRKDITAASVPAAAAGRNILHCQVRVLVNGVVASTAQAILESNVSSTVTSVSRECSHGSDADRALPQPFRHFQRVPCFTCYSPYHSSAKCGGRQGSFQEERHRVFSGMPLAPQPVSGLIFTHIDVADRLRHVTRLANTSAETTAQLKADGDENPPVDKGFADPPPRLGNRETPRLQPLLASGPTLGATSPRTASPSTDEWFDPGARKKKRESRTTVVQSVPTVSCNVTSPRQPRSVTAAGPGKSFQTVSAPYAKHSSAIKIFIHTKATVPPHGKQAAPNSSASSRSNEQRKRAARELENLLGGDHHVAEASPQTSTAKEQALAFARSRVEDGQRAVEVLTLTAAETKRATDQKRACYFEAHDQALEKAIAKEPTDDGSPTSLANNNAESHWMEYEYRTGSAAATRAMAEATNT
ncbi:uncharacterized protein CCR75_009472 [Bremia lactucae]|uniref:Uncharacterized protein n=1 Tax=Bremia lactucae TaxID=4779 RepID=A0A976FHT7_BRELC|nr:hypothetical protein CCR75_009472 [Bremia lactucae]